MAAPDHKGQVLDVLRELLVERRDDDVLAKKDLNRRLLW
jgi:hypothetical protein